MKQNLIFILTLLSALGCGLIAGVFFAFSAFVMKALAGLPPPQGIAAMQSINVAVLNRWFFAAFFGAAAACLVLAVSSMFMRQNPAELPTHWQRAVFDRHHSGDHRIQCAAKRRAGSRRSSERRCRKPMGQLRHCVDGVEPCANHRSPGGSGVAHDRALPRMILYLRWAGSCPGNCAVKKNVDSKVTVRPRGLRSIPIDFRNPWSSTWSFQSPGRNSPLSFFTSWVLQLASLQ